MEDAKPKKEPSFFMLANPARVIPSQVKFISLPPNQRYSPVSKRADPVGIVILVDSDPSAAEEVAKVERVAVGQVAEEADPPEPFEWDPNQN